MDDWGKSAGAAGLSKIAGGHTEGTVTSGTFSFDPDTMREIIMQWQDLAASYEESLDHAREMARVDPPGLDYASRAQADAANASGLAYYKYLVHNRDYCLNQAHLCQDALNTYLGVDQSSAEDISKPGDDGGIL